MYFNFLLIAQFQIYCKACRGSGPRTVVFKNNLLHSSAISCPASPFPLALRQGEGWGARQGEGECFLPSLTIFYKSRHANSNTVNNINKLHLYLIYSKNQKVSVPLQKRTEVNLDYLNKIGSDLDLNYQELTTGLSNKFKDNGVSIIKNRIKVHSNFEEGQKHRLFFYNTINTNTGLTIYSYSRKCGKTLIINILREKRKYIIDLQIFYKNTTYAYGY